MANHGVPLGPGCVGEPSVSATGRFAAGLSGRRAESEIPRLRAQCRAGLHQTGLQLGVILQTHTDTLRLDGSHASLAEEKKGNVPGRVSLCSFVDRWVENMKFHVEFVINRLTVRVQHRAAELAVTHHLGEVLFPAPGATSPGVPLPSLR